MNNHTGNIYLNKSTILTIFLIVINIMPVEVVTILLCSGITVLFIKPIIMRFPFFFNGANCLLCLTIIGIMGIFSNNMYSVCKDLWYFMIPFIAILFGFNVANKFKNNINIFKTIIASSAIIAIIHILQVVNYSLINKFVITDIRDEVSSGYFIVLTGFLILLWDMNSDMKLFNNIIYKAISLFLCSLSIILSFSRTLWIISVICVVVIVYMSLISKLLKFVFSCTILLILSLFIFSNGIIERYISDENTMTAKIQNSFNEILIRDYAEMEDINANWRGFESDKALQAYLSGSFVQYVFGQGFGAVVPLGFTMTLAEGEYDEIPILHNGYLYVLLKTGIVGLILYIAFLIHCYCLGSKISKNIILDIRFSGYMLVSISIIYALSTFVVSGIFNKGGLISISIENGLMFGILAKYLPNNYA